MAQRKDVARLKRLALGIGGRGFQVPGVIERDLADELGRDDWREFDGRGVRLIKSSKGMMMEECGCHANAAAVALRRGWECWTGLALSEDGCWRVHSWVRVPSTGAILETTGLRTKYLGVRLSPEAAEEML